VGYQPAYSFRRAGRQYRDGLPSRVLRITPLGPTKLATFTPHSHHPLNLRCSPASRIYLRRHHEPCSVALVTPPSACACAGHAVRERAASSGVQRWIRQPPKLRRCRRRGNFQGRLQPVQGRARSHHRSRCDCCHRRQYVHKSLIKVTVTNDSPAASATLFWLAKKRQWDVRQSIRRASRRFTGRSTAPASKHNRQTRRASIRLASPPPGKNSRARQERDVEKGLPMVSNEGRTTTTISSAPK
jgi:hypothetical protein